VAPALRFAQRGAMCPSGPCAGAPLRHGPSSSGRRRPAPATQHSASRSAAGARAGRRHAGAQLAAWCVQRFDLGAEATRSGCRGEAARAEALPRSRLSVDGDRREREAGGDAVRAEVPRRGGPPLPSSKHPDGPRWQTWVLEQARALAKIRRSSRFGRARVWRLAVSGCSGSAAPLLDCQDGQRGVEGRGFASCTPRA
jgi:hypothetical protein